MADIRIKDLATLESASLTGDVFVIDGTTGTRKLSAFSPSFGSNATVTGTLTVNSTSSFAGLIQLNNNVAQYWLDSGATQRRTALVSSGNSSYFGPVDAGWGSTGYFSAGTTMVLRTNGASGTFNDAVSISTGGNVSIASTSGSTSTSTGALVVGNGTSGGLGVGGAVNIGGTLSVLDGGTVSSAGTIRLPNNTSIGWRNAANSADIFLTVNNSNLFSFGSGAPVYVNNATASTSTSSGALVVSGGVGVAGAVNAGTFYGLVDGVTAPATESGYARIYVDSADGDLKVKFGDGTVKTIATDS